MTKTQIKAELRRSALEDYRPWFQCSMEAWSVAYKFRDVGYMSARGAVTRMFFLLVAEAIDD